MLIATKKMVRVKQQLKTKVWEALEISVPLRGATATYMSGILTIKGEKGEVSKKLTYPRVIIETTPEKVKVSTKHLSKREKKIIHTFRAHIKNMVTGAREGFEYRLSVVYAKFPLTVEMKGQTFTLKNLLGEKVPRTFDVPQDVKVEIKGGKEIVLTGIDKEKVGQVAASLEQLTRITHLDRRVIQDGIFIVEKPHRLYV